ncbi:hypothetical protein [Niveispirillum sp. KHB5.9]|uniref:hypothetical protein n=1 Tax=Niveispirillum sp. KHB5.9 TaxID=3400269 RepID=UPI003A837D7B
MMAAVTEQNMFSPVGDLQNNGKLLEPLYVENVLCAGFGAGRVDGEDRRGQRRIPEGDVRFDGIGKKSPPNQHRQAGRIE